MEDFICIWDASIASKNMNQFGFKQNSIAFFDSFMVYFTMFSDITDSDATFAGIGVSAGQVEDIHGEGYRAYDWQVFINNNMVNYGR